jgi:valyl-tRNA synthetase
MPAIGGGEDGRGFMDNQGGKKMTTVLEKSYTPGQIEDKWYSHWLEKGYFKAGTGPGKTNDNSFTIVIPPPNVTGVLHMGHALNNTLQDIMIRYKRMCGLNTLWLPGTDHAGIATQNVVEKELKKEGKRKEDLGREKFLEKIWEWKKVKGGKIIEQLKKLGCSCDWSRERFTMDDGLSRAVREVFVRLYREGLVYRGKYIINWCPRCTTAISDIEVLYTPTDGKLYHIKYPVENSTESLTVATTRPESMLGDTALAVHPEDERYRHLVGKFAILPLVGRKIRIIADPYVDKEFGTGALKVTPAHDMNDYLLGKKHGLEEIVVLDEKGVVNENGGQFKGLDRFVARDAVVVELEKQGLLVKIEPYQHSVGHCYRCDSVIEAYLSNQWFVKMEPLVAPAIDVVREGKVRFVPERWSKTYYEWLNNIKPWCISRQLWWGHRIPVWYCKSCGEVIVATSDPDVCPKCGSTMLAQDEDVLDTWFSSALWPFSTLGWPDETEDLKTFYPTNVLITGFDIIFFWVARMIFMGMKFMKQVPFHDVYITVLVRDEQARKMSKSLGNAIDPLDLIEKFGTDAVRFSMAAIAIQTSDIQLSMKTIEGYRNFVNKLWNATRFVLMNAGEKAPSVPRPRSCKLELPDEWILSELAELVRTVRGQLDSYDFCHSAKLIYDFVWSKLCDWYIEIVKPRMQGDDGPSKESCHATILYVFDTILRVLHPYIPFVTEELWPHVRREDEKAESLVVAAFPSAEVIESQIGVRRPNAVFGMNTLADIVTSARTMRSELGVSPQMKIKILIRSSSRNVLDLIDSNEEWMNTLMKTEKIERGAEIARPKASAASSVVASEKLVAGEESRIDIYIPLEGLLDLEKEKDRLEREIRKVEFELERSLGKINNADFISKAPEDVVLKEKEKVEKYSKLKEKIASSLQMIG